MLAKCVPLTYQPESSPTTLAGLARDSITKSALLPSDGRQTTNNYIGFGHDCMAYLRCHI